MKLWYMPIEPYKTRYTADWIEQFENEFKDINYETILGASTTNTLQTGQVLDSCGTHIYKFTQLNNLIQKISQGLIKDNDVILFADMWYPGLESLFYIRNITKINFKIYGILHAGSWDRYDFINSYNISSWCKNIERTWIENVDGIFVATNFHKQLIETWYGSTIDHLYVTGLPFYYKSFEKYKTEKKNIIVFPHRNAPEKQPDKFKALQELCKDFVCINTLEVCKNRQEYFELLGRAKYMVSFALQETFGYSTLEAMACGCCVIVPDRLSYKETVPKNHRYNTNTDEVAEVFKMIKSFDSNEYTLEKWENSISNMLKIIGADNEV